MARGELVNRLLCGAGADNGDTIRVNNDIHDLTGVLMPSSVASGEDIITLKLKNGYNVGIKAGNDAAITLVSKKKGIVKKEKKIPFDPKKPTVAVLGTGGTIACYVDYRTGAVHPATSAEDLAFSVPEIFEECNVRARVIYNMLSEDMQPDNWQKLAREVAKELNEGAAGVVIPHGTDTLGYTAAALAFMLNDLSGPVVLVGAQRSSDRPSSDAASNLLAAARVAARSDMGEVVVVMHGESSDTHLNIHRGTRVRKMHASRRDAFQSVNAVPLGRVTPEGKIELAGHYKKKCAGPVQVDDLMDEDVAIIQTYPGISPEHITGVVRDGVVLVGTGLGHISSRCLPAVGELIKKGAHVVMSSQCLWGRVNMNVYSTGRDLLALGVISAEDMLPEVAYIKLMWVLGHTKDAAEVRRLMASDVAGETSRRTPSETYGGERNASRL
ncbi:MAG: Glu-tRNA(Gln) amidotransferase GatDE subunit D [Thermoplasmata archaeon HGW-Thermoplasmata-1]|nr:MAG: Glu-tRNA(Gln) amidotransferase GatDE subunit D [Thermoplasmata archaeon HGW-Thermoplasmata-1]